jgi:hypothetical protein
MQVRDNEGRLFSPARDLRYAYPNAITAICEHFNRGAWQDLVDVCAREGASFDDLCDAMEAFIQFLNLCTKDPEQNLQQVLDEAGWFKLPPAAQIGLMAMFGRVATGQLFDAIRSTTPLGEKPEGIAPLATLAIHVLRTARQRPWYVRWWRWRQESTDGP